MSLREVIYYIYYGLGFLISIYFGFRLGFTDTHTPPAPFLLSVCVCLLGLVLLIVDVTLKKSKKVHVVGLVANLAIILFVLLLAA